MDLKKFKAIKNSIKVFEISVVEIGERVKMHRLDAGLTQDDMGDLLGITRSGYTAAELGRNSFTITQLCLMEIIFPGVTIGWLIKGDEASLSPDFEELKERNLRIKELTSMIEKKDIVINSIKESIKLIDFTE